MAKYLYKLGNWSFLHKKRVIFCSIILLILMGALALKMGASFSDNMTIPGTPADKAGKILSDEFKNGKSKGATVQIVYKTSKNETFEAKKAQDKITDSLNEIQKDTSVARVASPMQLKNINANKTIGYAQVTYKTDADNVKEDSKKLLLSSVEKLKAEGIEAELTGDISFSKDATSHTRSVGIILAFIILAVTFTSFLAAGLPIILAIFGLGTGMLGIVLGTNFIEIQSVSMSLGAMLALAVGIDYSLFIISRFRDEMENGKSPQEATALSIATAGSAVTFAGITVIIGLLGLSVSRIPFLTMMGVAAAFNILIAVLTAIIVLPAVLGFVGDKIAPKKGNRLLKFLTRSNEYKAPNNIWGKLIVKHPIVISMISICFLLLLASPILHLNLGLPTDGNTKSTDTTERRAYDLLTEGYGEGVHASLIVVAKTDSISNETLLSMKQIANDIKALSDVSYVASPIPSTSGKVYMINVTPKTGPNDVDTKNLVKSILKLTSKTEKSYGIKLMVTGTTAMNIDIAQKLNDALPLFAGLITVLAYIILAVVFRSLLIPLKAVLGFLLSICATIGFVVFVVQDGHGLSLFGFPATSPILAFLPFILIGILFGLAMDYEIFLVSKMREVYTKSGDARKAILDAISKSGKVVTAAGLIMFSVFFSFMMTPGATLKIMGMSLAFGVLFDAFMVRMTITPAIMGILGNAAWYLPKWLSKIIPNIDIEGENIST